MSVWLVPSVTDAIFDRPLERLPEEYAAAAQIVVTIVWAIFVVARRILLVRPADICNSSGIVGKSLSARRAIRDLCFEGNLRRDMCRQAHLYSW